MNGGTARKQYTRMITFRQEYVSILHPAPSVYHTRTVVYPLLCVTRTITHTTYCINTCTRDIEAPRGA